MNESTLRNIPQMEVLLGDPEVLSWISRLGRPLTLNTLRLSADEYRKDLKEGTSYRREDLIALFDKNCRRLHSRKIRPVLNATGVLLHTNMGRSPLSPEVWEACREINTGYSNLELSLETGKRGLRNGLVSRLLEEITGCEGALVVNNNAAAVFLLLTVFARGREVIVSRGEQVQIGGGFRIPEIMKESGAHLVEVGTTNITTTKDYLKAAGENTAMILKVHRSNFAIRGFSRTPTTADLSKNRPAGVVLAVDQGSGLLTGEFPGEISVKRHLKEGADLVCFSGDKLLGGPQAGIICGKADLIKSLESHPLMRTLRPGKTIYSLLEAVLQERSGAASGRIPSILAEGEAEILKKCRYLTRRITGGRLKIVPAGSCTGGGTAPDEFFPSRAVEIQPRRGVKAETILEILRQQEPPVLGFIHGDRVRLNPAALTDEELKRLASILKELPGVF